MDHFVFKENQAYCENIRLQEIAETYHTPAYVYSKTTLHRHLQLLKDAFASYPTEHCFAVKANSNTHLLKEIASFGYGADIVSLGELRRSQIAKIDPTKVVFSGVGKRPDEIQAALDWGILSFNVESTFEIKQIAKIAQKNKTTARICLRVNPNIDAKTNAKITTGMFTTKFGIVADQVRGLAKEISSQKHLRLIGLACHIGSQMTDLSPLRQAASFMGQLCKQLIEDGHPLEVINLGGGLGIRYQKETTPDLKDYAVALISGIKATGLTLIIEPGRVLVGNAGIILTKVLGVKVTPHKKFVIVDAGMNDLMRPSMYDSYHQVETVKKSVKTEIVDVVGPICESGDFFAKDRQVGCVQEGDYLFIRGCGAYASSMASNYNSRPRAIEILVEKDNSTVIRKREDLESLWKQEI